MTVFMSHQEEVDFRVKEFKYRLHEFMTMLDFKLSGSKHPKSAVTAMHLDKNVIRIAVDIQGNGNKSVYAFVTEKGDIHRPESWNSYGVKRASLYDEDFGIGKCLAHESHI